MEATPTRSPLVKKEPMPDSYSGLFDQPSSPGSPEGGDAMDRDPSALFSTPEPNNSLASPAPEESPAPGDSVPAKKRKSWGQVLPEPKTNLPPRKRAKTEDEKEQRRVERVLRNRRAAQSSRERKRQETEALAQRNKDLEATVLELQRANALLQEQLKKVRPDFIGGIPSSNSMTLSPPLFASHHMHRLAQPSQASRDLIEDLLQKTVNPASLSPALTPVAEDVPLSDPVAEQQLDTADARAAVAAQMETPSPEPMTQYPAAVLCNDLQCQGLERSRSGPALRPVLLPALLLLQQLATLAHNCSTTLLFLWETRPLAMISMSMRASLPLPPTRPILNSILSLVTNSISISPSTARPVMLTSGSRPNRSTTAPVALITTTTTTTSSSSHSNTLRLRTLRKILTCNRQLARPLQDATLEALRLSLTRRRGSDGLNDEECAASQLSALPSPARLMALLWAIRSTCKSIQVRDQTRRIRKGERKIRRVCREPRTSRF